MTTKREHTRLQVFFAIHIRVRCFRAVAWYELVKIRRLFGTSHRFHRLGSKRISGTGHLEKYPGGVVGVVWFSKRSSHPTDGWSKCALAAKEGTVARGRNSEEYGGLLQFLSCCTIKIRLDSSQASTYVVIQTTCTSYSS
jgi:hypothetical protein